MTTEEKLEHFETFCITDARTRSNKMLDEYSDALGKTFAEHQADAHRRADMQLKEETEKIKRDVNKKLSMDQIELKRTIGQKQEELKVKLFAELQEKLVKFMETPEYLSLLERRIREAVEIAGSDPVTIYMDPADKNKVSKLSLPQNLDLRISEYSFLGGIRAVISTKNILIDHSFQSRLAEEKEKFRFDQYEKKPGRNGGRIHG